MGAADVRLDKGRVAKALQEKVVLRDLCFDLGHLKLSRVKPATSEEFRALEAKTLTFLETAGSSRLLAPRRRPCEVLATLRPGRLIGISKPLAVSGAVIVEVRFAIAGA